MSRTSGAAERTDSSPIRSSLAQSTARSTRSAASSGGSRTRSSSGMNAYSCGSGVWPGRYMTASLPSCRTARVRASSEPRASPSGFSCVTTRKRSCRWRASAIAVRSVVCVIVVRRQQRRLRPLCCRLAPRVDLGERLACSYRLPALAQADDADCVVDRLPGDLPARAQLHGRDGDLPRPKLVDVAARRRDNLAHDGRRRKPSRIGVAALRPHPAVVGREGRTVSERRLRAAPTLVLVDAEIREREELCSRVHDELTSVLRPAAAHRLPRLPHLERVPDRTTERLVHVRQHADDVHPGLLAEGAHLLRELPRIV